MLCEKEETEASFASLPRHLQLRIFLLCPADQRVRMTFVCADWRAALSDPLFWADDADLSPLSGSRDVTDGLLRVLSAKAQGGLRSLDVSRLAEQETGFTTMPVLSDAAILQTVTANALSLQSIRLRCVGDWETVLLRRLRPLLLAAQHLQRLEADVHCEPADSTAALRNEAPFGALKILRLWVLNWNRDETAALTLADALPAHAGLEELVLDRAPLQTPAVFDAIVQAVLVSSLTRLLLKDCALPPASLAGLTRLLRHGRLAALDVRCTGPEHGVLFLEEGGVPGLCGALRSSTTLTDLGLNSASLWRSPAVGVALVDALVGHPTVRRLSLSGNRVAFGARVAAGAALGRLVAANAPSLAFLNVAGCGLGDDGLRSLVHAVSANTVLRELDCRGNHGAGDHDVGGGASTASSTFASEVLRSLRANTALAVFQTDGFSQPFAGEVLRMMRAAHL